MHKSILAPSMMCVSEWAGAEKALEALRAGGVEVLHADVMDGVFVTNISFGLPVIEALRKTSNMVFDVHLMIVNPQNYISQVRDAGAKYPV